MSSAHHTSTTTAKAAAATPTHSTNKSPSFTTTDPSKPQGSTSRTQSGSKPASGTSHSPTKTTSHSATGSTLSKGGISTGPVFDGTSNTISSISVNTTIPTDMTFSAFQSATGNVTSSLPLSTSAPPTTTDIIPTLTQSTSSSASATSDALTSLSHSSGMSVGAIVGLVLGVIAGTLLVLIAALCLYRRRYLLRRRTKERDFYGGASSTEYSNPFNDDKRYPSLMLEKESSQRMYNYAMGTPRANREPNSGGLLSPNTARDPFNTPRVRMDSVSPPVLGYEGHASSPTYVDHNPMQPATRGGEPSPHPAAGLVASYPKRSSSWRRSKSKKKKLAELKYRPNSTLTEGERNTAKALIRIESSSSNEDPREQDIPMNSYESGPRILRDIGRGSRRSADGHELRPQNTSQSYGSTQDGHPFRFDDRPPRPREIPAAIVSPGPTMDHRRVRSDETYNSQTIQSQYLSPPSAPRRPPHPDSDEGATFRGIANLLAARSAHAPASPPSHYAPTPSPIRTSPPTRRPFATRSSPTNFEQSRSPAPPSKPIPAHFVQRAAHPRKYAEPSSSRPGGVPAYFGRRSESVEDDGGATSRPSTFGEEGTLARSSESWHGGKAL